MPKGGDNDPRRFRGSSTDIASYVSFFVDPI
jgi:hypothetical protein